MVNDKVCYFNDIEIVVKNNNVYINNVPLVLLGSGVDGYVYQYYDKAIKLYRDDYLVKEHLNREQLTLLSSIDSKKIILPKVLLDSSELNPGYVMNYINRENEKDILISDKSNLIVEIRLLEKELELLGKNNFLLNDKLTNNLFYDGKLYLFDSDSFIYDKKVDFSRQNIEIFSWLFIRDIIFCLNDELDKKEMISYVRKLNYLYKKSGYLLLSDFLENSIYSDNLIDVRNSFVMKKVKK